MLILELVISAVITLIITLFCKPDFNPLICIILFNVIFMNCRLCYLEEELKKVPTFIKENLQLWNHMAEHIKIVEEEEKDD